ncbi:ribosome biogenesis GTPase Der [Aestuariirhabdus sp. Z084]|uniref:ribosome biogenesis GTPase Der n=1 Tax=Aestuariirhabdus haliotis TaxID=2918751 RepID=UPI00201B3776|nr:ribosome biogenesis GTPase Der [Aestuariirhabdus haliotis]MCL6415356.1 ribosome biogenesis GTPase Der [Aestuariirhabdus haliotis]MCL6419112.1 ribosome biogenesis GTPase Der [Aestuariirhabdus haliotis]
MVPVIALVGRPNVGKSTLFNRLTRSRDALVADFSGLTRDRKYGEGKMGERPFIVIDTGGISGDEAGIDTVMAEQSLLAIEEADVVLFMVDGREGRTAAEDMIAQHLRTRQKKSYLVVNKIDTVDPDSAASDFYALGMEQPYMIAAAHGRGVRQMVDHLLASFPLPEEESEAEEAEGGIKIGVVGRPNVGKSTLVNRLLGEDRVVVYDHAGTTRDSIYIPYTRHDKPYTLIDTAGVRKRGRINESVEKFSVIKTLQAIQDANVVVLVLDAREGLVDQDLHLLGFIIETGRALVIAFNKWDGMSQDEKREIKEALERRLVFADFARIHFISALHGTGVGHLYESIEEAYECAMQRWSASRLTQLLEDAISDHQPPLVRGHRIKLRYAHMGGTNPPIIVIHGNQTEAVPNSYRRYLENTFRRVLKLVGTPIRFEFRTGDNPFSGKKNKLNQRQIAKKKRLVQHIKKAEKKRKKK